MTCRSLNYWTKRKMIMNDNTLKALVADLWDCRHRLQEMIIGRLARVGVVLPHDPASPGQSVLAERAGLLVLTQPVQVVGEVVR